MNPQFHIQIPRSPNLSKCHVVVSVTQQYETNVAETKKRKKRKLHHIGFAVYEVPPHMTRLTPLYVAEHVIIYTYFSKQCVEILEIKQISFFPLKELNSTLEKS